MDSFLEFTVHYFYLFIGLSVFLIFSLIGCIVKDKRDERFLRKNEIDKELEARMNVAEATNMTLGQMVKTSEVKKAENNNADSAPKQPEQTQENSSK